MMTYWLLNGLEDWRQFNRNEIHHFHMDRNSYLLGFDSKHGNVGDFIGKFHDILEDRYTWLQRTGFHYGFCRRYLEASYADVSGLRITSNSKTSAHLALFSCLTIRMNRKLTQKTAEMRKLCSKTMKNRIFAQNWINLHRNIQTLEISDFKP